MRVNANSWDCGNGIQCEQIEGDDTGLFITFTKKTDYMILEGVIQRYYDDGYENIKIKCEGDEHYTRVDRNDIFGSILCRKK